jgi:hypothetical protein
MATETPSAARTKALALIPAAAALAYPFVLAAFHAVVSISAAGAGALLILAFALPLSGFAVVYRLTRAPRSSESVAASRLAYASLAAPPLFVLLGVARGLLHIRIPELAIWAAFWMLAAVYVGFAPSAAPADRIQAPPAVWRVAHGISAAFIACYVLFHLTNHLFGLAGPETHAAIMKAGRTVYRSAFIEPVLVTLMLFQVGSGVRLAWRWSGFRIDTYRIFQIGSGAYLAAFILTHMNSALVSARAVHKIDTDWGWASGAPVGLIQDAWNIRLLPHYALGVFFIIGHLSSGLRAVMLAHGVRAQVADRFWAAGLIAGGALSTAIMCALCGLRV